MSWHLLLAHPGIVGFGSLVWDPLRGSSGLGQAWPILAGLAGASVHCPLRSTEEPQFSSSAWSLVLEQAGLGSSA